MKLSIYQLQTFKKKSIRPSQSETSSAKLYGPVYAAIARNDSPQTQVFEVLQVCPAWFNVSKINKNKKMSR